MTCLFFFNSFKNVIAVGDDDANKQGKQNLELQF